MSDKHAFVAIVHQLYKIMYQISIEQALDACDQNN